MTAIQLLNAALIKKALLITDAPSKMPDPKTNNPVFNPNNNEPILGSDKGHLKELMKITDSGKTDAMKSPQMTHVKEEEPQNYYKPSTAPMFPKAAVSGWEAADTVTDFVPIVGGIKDIGKGVVDMGKGNWWSGAGNVAMGLGSLGLDALTLGGSSLAKGAIKTVGKAGLRAGANQLAKGVAERSGKQLATGLAKNVAAQGAVAGGIEGAGQYMDYRDQKAKDEERDQYIRSVKAENMGNIWTAPEQSPGYQGMPPPPATAPVTTQPPINPAIQPAAYRTGPWNRPATPYPYAPGRNGLQQAAPI